MGILNGKIAAITGGSRGIGRGIAEAYLAAGAKLLIVPPPVTSLSYLIFL